MGIDSSRGHIIATKVIVLVVFLFLTAEFVFIVLFIQAIILFVLVLMGTERKFVFRQVFSKSLAHRLYAGMARVAKAARNGCRYRRTFGFYLNALPRSGEWYAPLICGCCSLAGVS